MAILAPIDSLDDYDEEAAGPLKQRVLAFLECFG
jgi:hypothetical protein